MSEIHRTIIFLLCCMDIRLGLSI